MKNLKWFSPKSLRSQEESEQSQFEQQGDVSVSSDFRSYINLNKKNISDDIHFHNLKTQDAILVAKIIKSSLGEKYKFNNILELGCGAGFSSSGLRDIFKSSKIKAIDVSSNAIEYAKRTFAAIDFEVCGIDENSKINGAPFDLIIAYEFYPFSRTSDWDYQLGIIKNLLENGSTIYIANVGNDDSVFKNREMIKNNPELKLLHCGIFPKSKIYQLVPSFLYSGLITKLFCHVLGKRFVSMMIIGSAK